MGNAIISTLSGLAAIAAIRGALAALANIHRSFCCEKAMRTIRRVIAQRLARRGFRRVDFIGARSE
jgi:hypothetical protein